MKKIISFLFLTLALMAMNRVEAQVTVTKAKDGTALGYQGTCGAEGDGTNISWGLVVRNGVLRIIGDGDMCDNPTWKPYKDYIKVVTFSDGITSIGAFAFSDCKNLESIAHLPKTLVKIENKAFARTKLESITLGPLERFGCSVFEYCENLKSVTFEGDIKSFGRCCFTGCINLEQVVMPKCATHMGFWNFFRCEKLPVINDIRYADTYLIKAVEKNKKAYVIKKGTKWIEENAFRKCDQMEMITIPETVLEIDCMAFQDCVGLKSVTCLAIEPPVLGWGLSAEGVFTNLDCSQITLYVPSQSVEAYKKDEQWGKFKIVGI